MALTQEQVKERVNYLGGGDCAAVLGLSRYRTPLQVWAQKTGQIPAVDPELEKKIFIRLGSKLEQAVADLFMEETGKQVVPEAGVLFHPRYPFIGGNIDRRVVGEDAILECKTAGHFKRHEWESEEIPVEYILQCVHYLAVTGAKRAYIAVLLGNTEFKYKTIERDEVLIADVVKKEVAFWEKFVVPRVMPGQVTGQDADVLYRLFPVAAQESVIELGDEADKIIESLDSLQADQKVLEEQIEKQKNELKAMLRTFEAGVTSKYRFTWKNQSAKRIDVDRLKKEEPALFERFLKVTDMRVFRFGIRRA